MLDCSAAAAWLRTNALVLHVICVWIICLSHRDILTCHISLCGRITCCEHVLRYIDMTVRRHFSKPNLTSICKLLHLIKLLWFCLSSTPDARNVRKPHNLFEGHLRQVVCLLHSWYHRSSNSKRSQCLSATIPPNH